MDTSRSTLSPEQIISVFNTKGFALDTRELALNLIGVRSAEREAGRFDDLLILMRLVDGEWELHTCEFTVDPGTRYLLRPINRSGTAGLTPGQHPKAWRVDTHNGWVRTLCQRLAPVRVYRDDDRDLELDYAESTVQEGMFGINFHPDRAEPHGQSGRNVSASAGCQVFRYQRDHALMMRLVDEHIAVYGDGFGYTLLDEIDFLIEAAVILDGTEERELVPVTGKHTSLPVAAEIATWAQWIVDMEGRRDADGELLVYNLPSGDGGGAYEVAGINQRYHPQKAARLKHLIETGKPALAEQEAMAYIIDYTSVAEGWHSDGRVASFLKDCAFNRGPTGAAKILQIALKTAGTYTGPRDGKVGPKTLAGAAKHTAEDLLPRLLLARQTYERLIVKRNENSKFWNGLVNRWVNALQIALSVGDPDVDLK